ncbi:hypothetical protein D3C73_1115980 [compost metagenome]
MKLAAGIGRVNLLPEQLKELAVWENFRVEGNLHRFDMSGRIGADLLIGRVHRMSAGIAGDNSVDSRQIFKRGYHTPETSACKGRFFRLRAYIVSLNIAH